jgi:hypothetical protein
MRHTCAVTASLAVHCWGQASQGELGVPGLRHSPVPVPVPLPEPVVQVRCSQALTCARSAAGRVYCWGDDDAQSPDPATQPLPPTEVARLRGATDLWVLPHAVCGLHPSEVRCDGLELAAPPPGLRPLRFVQSPPRLPQVCTVSADAHGSEDALCQPGREVPRQGARPRPAIAPKTWPSAKPAEPAPPAKPADSHAAPAPASGPADARPAGGTLHAAAFWGGSLCRLLDSGPACDPLLVPGLLAALSGTRRPQVLSLRDDALCLRRDDGTAGCTSWMGSRLLPPVSTLGPVRALALGDSHACAILTTGRIRCWGEASHGELGDGSRYVIPSPQRVFRGAAELAVADDLSCARRPDGTVACWGALAGCDRDESCERWEAPRPVPTPTPARRLALASPLSTRRLCMQGDTGWACRFGDWRPVPRLPTPLAQVEGDLLGQDGRAWRWAPSNPPERPRPHFFQLAGRRLRALSPDGTCAIAEGGQVLCGHCGVCGPAEARRILTVLAQPPAAVAVSRTIHDGGVHGVCALTAEGRVACTDLDRAPFARAEVQRPFLADVTAALANVQALAFADVPGPGLGWFGCLLLHSGEVQCLGDNRDGQLGDGSQVSRRQPQTVAGLASVAEIGVGRDHACARTGAGDVYCWGSSRRGAVGLGLPTFRETPSEVAAAASLPAPP